MNRFRCEAYMPNYGTRACLTQDPTARQYPRRPTWIEQLDADEADQRMITADKDRITRSQSTHPESGCLSAKRSDLIRILSAPVRVSCRFQDHRSLFDGSRRKEVAGSLMRQEGQRPGAFLLLLRGESMRRASRDIAPRQRACPAARQRPPARADAIGCSLR